MHVIDETRVAQPLVLSETILIYREAGRLEKADAALAMLADVTDGVIGPGRLLDKVTLETMFRQLQGKGGERLMLPPHILWLDAARMVWHVPACRRPIWFGTRANKALAPLNGQEVTHPPLLFVADAGQRGQGKLSIFALDSDTRPTATTPVYRAPYFNLYSRGNMCIGNVKLPERVGPGFLTEWETAFYNSEFTHNNTGGQLTLFNGGHDALWKAMRTRKRFPVQSLLVSPTADSIRTVGEAIAR